VRFESALRYRLILRRNVLEDFLCDGGKFVSPNATQHVVKVLFHKGEVLDASFNVGPVEF
jgi:hypothetical protein